MNYPNNRELDNDNSWDDGQLSDNEDNNISNSNEDREYTWRHNEAEVESYTWDDKRIEYSDNFSWDNQEQYFDDFNWSDNNGQDRDEDWDENNTNEEEENWNEDTIQEEDWDEDTTQEENWDEDIKGITEDIEDLDNDGVDNIINGLQGIQGPIGPQGSIVEGIREICIRPMHHILDQLKELSADDIEIGTEMQGTILSSRIVNINDYIVRVRNSFREIAIPIHQIVGIYSRRLPQVSLLPEPNNTRNGDCDCCERPLREYCSKHIGSDFNINTLARDEIFSSLKGTITKVGEGILVLSNTVAILIYKIISIEKDARSSVNDYDEND